jgi:hypothetical protein
MGVFDRVLEAAAPSGRQLDRTAGDPEIPVRLIELLFAGFEDADPDAGEKYHR